MKSNVREIRKCAPFKKEIISFDKKGKKVITVKEITDCYLVVLKDGSSVALTEKQLSEYGIRGTLPDTNKPIISNKPEVIDEIEEDLDEEEETEVVTEVTEPTKEAAPVLKLSGNSPIVIK